MKIAVLLLSLLGVDPNPHAEPGILDGVARTIGKQPKYESAPRYALLVLGAQAQSKVWLVEDGKTLYIDKNANGDLTDDGPPIKPTNEKQFGLSSSWRFDYLLDEFGSFDSSRHTALRLARWNHGEEKDNYGLSMTLNGQVPMYAGWVPFWANTPEAAPLIHFGGSLRPQMLRFKGFVVESGQRRLSLAFFNPGRGRGANAMLSIDALPLTTVPILHIDWPVAKDAPPLKTNYRLTQRCCYWEFYITDFQVPKEAVEGTAKVAVSFSDGGIPLELATDHIDVPVFPKGREAAK